MRSVADQRVHHGGPEAKSWYMYFATSRKSMTRRESLAHLLALLPAWAMFPALRSQAESTSSTSLRIGVAEMPITPNWSTPLWGYGGRPPYSCGVLDDIFAKAVLFDCGKVFL